MIVPTVLFFVFEYVFNHLRSGICNLSRMQGTLSLVQRFSSFTCDLWLPFLYLYIFLSPRFGYRSRGKQKLRSLVLPLTPLDSSP